MVAEISPDMRKVFGSLARAFSFRKRITLEEYLRAGNVVIPETKGKGGIFDLDARPYHRGIARAYHIWNYMDLVWAAQVGKSAFLSAVLNYIANQEPAPVMIGFPDRANAARRSRNELIPSLERSPGTAEEMTGIRNALSTFEFRLRRMVVMLVWAGSSSILASETAKVLIGDEVAKWVQRDKKEGDPVALFFRRDTDHRPLNRRLLATTPNYEHTHGWIEWLIGTQHRFFVPCPHCGDPEKLKHVRDPEDRYSEDELAEDLEAAGYQVLEWSAGEDGKAGITGWGESRDPEYVEAHACYRCKWCRQTFGDVESNRMLKHGKWIGRFPKRKWFSSQLPSWYSPQVTFGGVARRFFEAQGNRLLLQDWTNSDKAEAFVETGGEKDESRIRKHCLDYDAKTIPFRPLVIIITVDVQMSEMYYEIRAHGKERRYAHIDCGRLPRLRKKIVEDGLEKYSAGLDLADGLMAREFKCLADGGIYTPTYGFMDSGDGEETADIYRWVASHPGWIALKGQDNQKDLIKFSYPEKELGLDGRQRSKTDGAMLISFNTGLMKDGWAMRWEEIPESVEDIGAWMLPREVSDQYAFQLTQEAPVEITVGQYGRQKRFWKRKSPQNHFFDCSYYQHAVSVGMEVDEMEFPDEEETAPAAAPTASDVKQNGNWVTGSKT